MVLELLEVVPLHKHPKYLKPCCDMINDEWPRSETARMMSLKASCDKLPTSLILIHDRKQVLGHCKLTPIPSLPNSCFIEAVVIIKSMRGKKLGTYLMGKVEGYCKEILKLDMLHLSTKGQENFYAKLGYEVCPPISIYGNNSTINIIPRDIDSNERESRALDTKSVAPPPPPMPKPQVNLNINLKSNKTFMYKYLAKHHVN